MSEWTREEVESYEKWQASRLDGHYCADWGEMAVNAFSFEYDSCHCSGIKSILGRVINRYMMWRFNLGWWWMVGRHGKNPVKWLIKALTEI